MAKPLGESLRSILLAPLSIVLFYLLMATVPFLRAPSWEATWMYWIVASISVVAYAVAVPAGMLLMRLYHGVGGPPPSACLGTGIVCALAAAMVADFPEPNFQRVRYYLFAAFAGGLWGVTLYRLSKNENR